MALWFQNDKEKSRLWRRQIVIRKYKSAYSNLIIKPHPEEYLSDMFRNIAANVNEKDKQQKERKLVKNGNKRPYHFFNIDSSGSYSVTW